MFPATRRPRANEPKRMPTAPAHSIITARIDHGPTLPDLLATRPARGALGLSPDSTQYLYDRFYGDRLETADGTRQFHSLCRRYIKNGGRILEIGAGPSNPTSQFLATLGWLEGLDVSTEVRDNDALEHAHVFDGESFPLPDEQFEWCVSNYVLEHVTNPERHFSEIRRVLIPGGRYIFRTPNLFHYVALASRLLPHAAHKAIANRVRALESDAHEPWPTVYKANTQRALTRHASKSRLTLESIALIEPDPSYGRASAYLFYPMMGYERLVNATGLLSAFRANILGVLRKD
jgi:SAM-dependent methyltransferase